MDFGGFYTVTASNIIDAAKSLGVQAKLLPDGDAQLAISAEEFNGREYIGAFSDEFICIHGAAPYSFVDDLPTHRPVKKPCCKQCHGGIERPNELEVEQAKRYLLNGHQIPLTKLQKMEAEDRKIKIIKPGAGALILAAQALGLKTIVPFSGGYHISLPTKTESQIEILKKEAAVNKKFVKTVGNA